MNEATLIFNHGDEFVEKLKSFQPEMFSNADEMDAMIQMMDEVGFTAGDYFDDDKMKLNADEYRYNAEIVFEDEDGEYFNECKESGDYLFNWGDGICVSW